MMKFLKDRGMRKNMIRAIFLIAFIMVCLSSSYYTIIGVQCLINAIAVLGLVLVSGYTRQIHLGQAAFIGLGAYTSAVLMSKVGMNFWLTIPCALLLSMLVGVLLGIPTLKLREGPYLAMVTQIFGEIIFVLLINMEGVTGGSYGLAGFGKPSIGSFKIDTKVKLLFLTTIFFIICFFVTARVTRSKYGRFFISIRESQEAALSVGVNTTKFKLLAVVICSALGGLAGVFYSQCLGFLSPEQFRWNISLTLISMAIIGGIGDIDGGVLGAIVLTFLPELLRDFSAQWRMITYGVLLILVLTFLPDGVISLIGKKPLEIKKMLKERTELLFTDERAKRRNQLKKTMRT